MNHKCSTVEDIANPKWTTAAGGSTARFPLHAAPSLIGCMAEQLVTTTRGVFIFADWHSGMGEGLSWIIA